MTLQGIKTYLSSGVDEAIVRTVKSTFRFMIAAGVAYGIKLVGDYHPDNVDAVLAVAVVDRSLKFLWIYFTTGLDSTPTVTSVDGTAVVTPSGL